MIEDVVTKETAAISAKSDSEDEVKSKLPQVSVFFLQLKINDIVRFEAIFVFFEWEIRW